MYPSHMAETIRQNRRGSFAGSEYSHQSDMSSILSESNLGTLDLYHQQHGHDNEKPLLRRFELDALPNDLKIPRKSVNDNPMISASGLYGDDTSNASSVVTGGSSRANERRSGIGSSFLPGPPSVEDNFSVLGEVDACSVRSERPLVRGRRASMSNAFDMSKSDHDAIVKTFKKPSNTSDSEDNKKKRGGGRGRRNSMFGSVVTLSSIKSEVNEGTEEPKKLRGGRRPRNRRASVGGPYVEGESDVSNSAVDSDAGPSRRLPSRSKSSDAADKFGIPQQQMNRPIRKGRRASLTHGPRRRASTAGITTTENQYGYGQGNHENDRSIADSTFYGSSDMLSYCDNSYAGESFAEEPGIEFLAMAHKSQEAPSPQGMEIKPKIQPLRSADMKSYTNDVPLTITATSAGGSEHDATNGVRSKLTTIQSARNLKPKPKPKRSSYVPNVYAPQKGLLGGDETDTEQEEELLSLHSSNRSLNQLQPQKNQQLPKRAPSPVGEVNQQQHQQGPKLLYQNDDNDDNDDENDHDPLPKSGDGDDNEEENHNNNADDSSHKSSISSKDSSIHNPVNGPPSFYMNHDSRRSIEDQPMNGAPAFYTQANEKKNVGNHVQKQPIAEHEEMPANGPPAFYGSAPQKNIVSARGEWGCGLSEEISEIESKNIPYLHKHLPGGVAKFHNSHRTREDMDHEDPLHFSDEEDDNGYLNKNLRSKTAPPDAGLGYEHIYDEDDHASPSHFQKQHHYRHEGDDDYTEADEDNDDDDDDDDDDGGGQYDDEDYYAEEGAPRTRASMEFINMATMSKEKEKSAVKAQLLPNFIPASGCTNASDFVVRVFVARMRLGITVTKHSRARWCNSHDRVLHILEDGIHLTYIPTLEQEEEEERKRQEQSAVGAGIGNFGAAVLNFGRMGRNAKTSSNTNTGRITNKEPPRFDLRKCIEVRHAWSRDPKHPKFTGTATLRQKCQDGTAKQSFALIFPDRTVDFTAHTNDQCKILMEGFSALCFRLQMAQLEADNDNVLGGSAKGSVKGSEKNTASTAGSIHFAANTSETGTNASTVPWGL